MRTWLGEGRLGGDSLVWREGWREWQEAAAVFPQLRPERPPPPRPSQSATRRSNSTSAKTRGIRTKRRRRVSAAEGLVAHLVLTAAVVFFVCVFFYVLNGQR